MACTNRFGWPGNRWDRGPDWTTTGVIRPVTEIARGVCVAVDDCTGVWNPAVILLGPWGPEPGQQCRAPVGIQPHRPGAKPHPARIPAGRLEARKPHPSADPGAVLAGLPVLQCPREITHPGGGALLGVA